MIKGILFTALLAVPTLSIADPIYKQQSSSGSVVYSSKKPSDAAKPHDLPEIMHGDSPIAKVNLESCNNHGGVNCQAAADSDGSVICFDGYRESSERFLWKCKSAKLELVQITDPDPDGKITIVVRNLKSVTALSPSVILHGENREKLTLQGPATLEPFGIGEFSLQLPKRDKLDTPSKPTSNQVELTCENCG